MWPLDGVARPEVVARLCRRRTGQGRWLLMFRETRKRREDL